MMFVRNHGRRIFLCYSLVQFEDAHLCSHNFVFVFIAFSLGVDDLLVLDPMTLNLFGAHSWFLLDSNQCLGFEVIFLSVQDARLHHCSCFMFLLQFKALFVGVGLENSLYDAILRDIFECSIDDVGIDDPAFLLGVIVGT